MLTKHVPVVPSCVQKQHTFGFSKHIPQTIILTAALFILRDRYTPHIYQHLRPSRQRLFRFHSSWQYIKDCFVWSLKKNLVYRFLHTECWLLVWVENCTHPFKLLIVLAKHMKLANWSSFCDNPFYSCTHALCITNTIRSTDELGEEGLKLQDFSNTTACKVRNKQGFSGAAVENFSTDFL